MSQLIDELEAHSDDGVTCDSSCYECLRDYQNQPYHPLLDWRLAADLGRVAFGVPFDASRYDELSFGLASRFADSFPRWQATWVAGLPTVLDTDGDQAFLITHPFEHRSPHFLSDRVASAYIELEDDGYTLWAPTPGESAPPKALTLQSSFDLLRRPGFVESTVRAFR